MKILGDLCCFPLLGALTNRMLRPFGFFPAVADHLVH